MDRLGKVAVSLRKFKFVLAAFLVVAALSSIDQSANAQSKFKKLPPDGIEIFDQQRARLTVRVTKLRKELNKLVDDASDASTWHPDVEVFIRAVDLALQQNLFYKKNDPATATKLLDEAERRINALKSGDRGLKLVAVPNRKDQDEKLPILAAGGFQSAIDDSFQPYGIVLPTDYDPDKSYRMDVWLHGRGDSKLELAFLAERITKVGLYAPANTIVLHPFGRHCNAFKFAGETDVYEAMAHVQSRFKVDPDRISIRGFSMGGAGCWHLAVHNPTQWFAANPGAGFVDTIKYQGWTDNLPFELGETRIKLLRLYDVLPWTANLQNTNLIAYSGEVDKQRQAADRVIEQTKKLGIETEYVIGKKMGHKIDDPSKGIIEAKIDQWAALPKASPRRSIDFTTYTLRYANADWLTVTGMKQQWAKANVRAEITESKTLKIKTDAITNLQLDFAESGWPGKKEVGLSIDGERFYISDMDNQKPGLQCNLARGKQWDQIVGESNELRKKPGIQGPIDDAFRSRFLFVLPTRPAANGVVERWIQREIQYSTSRWRKLMRGNVRTVDDVDVTDEQVKNNHLICFGDFRSNRYLFKLASRLPIKWTRDKLELAGEGFDPAVHAPVFCYPNPENPDRYLVVNSGMTFREFSNVSNSRQIAMLPDWAVLEVDENHDDSIFAGKIAAEGFFDEQWKLPSDR